MSEWDAGPGRERILFSARIRQENLKRRADKDGAVRVAELNDLERVPSGARLLARIDSSRGGTHPAQYDSHHK